MPDQALACASMERFLLAVSGSGDSSGSGSGGAPYRAYLYGPSSTGKTTAALVVALLLTCDGPLPDHALTDPDAWLDEMRSNGDTFTECIFTLHVNILKRQTAAPLLLIYNFFKSLHSRLGANESLAPRVVLIFEEIHQAPPAFLQPLMTLFNHGYLELPMKDEVLPVRVSCPLPLVILSTGTSPDEGSVLQRERPPSDSAIRCEINNRVIRDESLSSRVVGWPVVLLPYTKAEMPRIARTCLARLLTRVCELKGYHRKFDDKTWYASPKLSAWALRKLASTKCMVRTWQDALRIELLAAIQLAREQPLVGLDTWRAVRFTIKDDVIVAKRDGVARFPSLEEVWCEVLTYLDDGEPASAGCAFLPDPAVMRLLYEQHLQALVVAGADADVSIAETLATWLAKLKRKSRKRALDSDRCIYRIRAEEDDGCIIMLHLHFAHAGLEAANYSKGMALPLPPLPIEPAVRQHADAEMVAHASRLWLRQLRQCPEFTQSAHLWPLLRKFEQPRESWPTLDKLEAADFPWCRPSGPLDFAGDDFFSCPGTNPLDLDDDGSSVTSSSAVSYLSRHRPASEVVIHQPILDEVAYLPLSQRVLAAKYGWPLDRREQDKRMASLRMELKRKYSDDDDDDDVCIEGDAHSSWQNEARLRWSRELGIKRIRSDASFVRAEVIDQIAEADDWIDQGN